MWYTFLFFSPGFFPGLGLKKYFGVILIVGFSSSYCHTMGTDFFPYIALFLGNIRFKIHCLFENGNEIASKKKKTLHISLLNDNLQCDFQYLRRRHHVRVPEASVGLLLYGELLPLQRAEKLDLLRRWHRHQVGLLGRLLVAPAAAAASTHRHLPAERTVC